MAITTAPHDVRIGHTEFFANPFAVPVATCCERGAVCLWSEDAEHIRAIGIHHAEETGHRVKVAEGRALTVIEVTS